LAALVSQRGDAVLAATRRAANGDEEVVGAAARALQPTLDDDDRTGRHSYNILNYRFSFV
jgi:hypothetical protein